jgi:hypothetical protein
MPFDPDAAIGADLFLPDRHDLFQTVDTVTRRLKCALVAMAAGAGYKGRHFAHFQTADALDKGHTAHRRPASPNLVSDLSHLLFGHCLVGLVIQMQRFRRQAVAPSLAAHKAGKADYCADFRTHQAGLDSSDVQRFRRNCEIGRVGEFAAAADRREKSDLIPGIDQGVRPGIGAVDRYQGSR